MVLETNHIIEFPIDLRNKKSCLISLRSFAGARTGNKTILPPPPPPPPFPYRNNPYSIYYLALTANIQKTHQYLWILIWRATKTECTKQNEFHAKQLHSFILHANYLYSTSQCLLDVPRFHYKRNAHDTPAHKKFKFHACQLNTNEYKFIDQAAS